MRLDENTVMLNCVLTLGMLPFKAFFNFFKKKNSFAGLLIFYINLDHIYNKNFNYQNLCIPLFSHVEVLINFLFRNNCSCVPFFLFFAQYVSFTCVYKWHNIKIVNVSFTD